MVQEKNKTRIKIENFYLQAVSEARMVGFSYPYFCFETTAPLKQKQLKIGRMIRIGETRFRY